MESKKTIVKSKSAVQLFLRNDFIHSFIFLLIFILLLLTSCAGSGTQHDAIISKYDASIENENEHLAKGEQLNAELVQKGNSLKKAYSAADYKIGPEDLLEIDVFQVPELKTNVRVSAKGYIKLPLADSIEASGLSVGELETLVGKRLQKFLTEPMVSVFVKEYRSQQISVLGSVRDPKTYYATGQKYLLDMLSMAGGLAPDAGSVCIVQRPVKGDSGEKESVEKIVVDLDELLMHGSADLNIPIFSGDVVQVPKAGIFFVDGAVREPGEFPLKRGTTFTQAISRAKGKNFDASDSEMKLYRDSGKRGKEVISVDYNAVLAGQEPDIEIRDKDIIIVSSSTIKRIMNTLSGALNLGMFSIGGGRPF
jgi:polysaccharide export outer membrane protein